MTRKLATGVRVGEDVFIAFNPEVEVISCSLQRRHRGRKFLGAIAPTACGGWALVFDMNRQRVSDRTIYASEEEAALALYHSR